MLLFSGKAYIDPLVCRAVNPCLRLMQPGNEVAIRRSQVAERIAAPEALAHKMHWPFNLALDPRCVRWRHLRFETVVYRERHESLRELRAHALSRFWRLAYVPDVDV